MAIETVRRVGTYAPLSATYYQDDAVAEAGEAAELLFLRGLAFSAQRLENNGYISKAQVTRFVGVGMADALERADRLVEVGLWDAVDGGYRIRSWLRWNKSAEEVGRYRARDAGRKRDSRADGGSDVRAESETPSERSPSGRPSGIRAESARPSDTQNHVTPLQNQTNKEHAHDEARDEVPHDEAASPASRASARTPKPGSDRDPAWAEFWEAYPRKVGKAEARKAWAKTIKGGQDPAEVVAGAKRYAAEMARQGTPADKIKYPQGWLSGERWNDEPVSTTTATAYHGGSGGAWWNN